MRIGSSGETIRIPSGNDRQKALAHLDTELGKILPGKRACVSLAGLKNAGVDPDEFVKLIYQHHGRGVTVGFTEETLCA